MSKLCVIVPCYNESSRLKISEFEDYIHKHDYHFCFVNDGSKDNTQIILKEIQSKFPDKVLVVNLEKNSGKAEAVRQGILEASKENNYKFLAFFDADLAIPLNEIENLLMIAQKNSRYLLFMGIRLKRLGAEINRKPYRHYLGRIFATLVSNLFRLPAYDTQCGIKLFNSKFSEDVFAKPFFSKWFFDIEILLRIKLFYNNNLSYNGVCEIPLKRWGEISGSRLTIKDFIFVPFELVRLRLKYKRK